MRKTAPRKIRAAERRLRAIELRKAGASFDQIAAELGYADRSGAYRAVREALATLAAEQNEATAGHVALDLERLDDLLRAVWAGALAGSLGPHQQALKVLHGRWKLLGLDVPARQRSLLDEIRAAGVDRPAFDPMTDPEAAELASRLMQRRTELQDGSAPGAPESEARAPESDEARKRTEDALRNLDQRICRDRG